MLCCENANINFYNATEEEHTNKHLLHDRGWIPYSKCYIQMLHQLILIFQAIINNFTFV